MSTGDKIRKNVKLNKPAAEVVWKLPPTAEQIQCCQSQRSDCGDVVSQARPDLYRICIKMQDDQSLTSDEFSSNVASDRECDNLLEDVFKFRSWQCKETLHIDLALKLAASSVVINL